MGRDRRSPRALRAGIAGTALIAFLLSGCGGGRSPASVAHIGNSAPATTVGAAAGAGGMPSLQQLYQDAVAYAGCMRSHGHPNFPVPQMVNNATQQEVGFGQGLDLTGPQYRSANKTCQVLLPNGGGGPSQAEVRAQLAKDLKFSQCMRLHGIPNFPDPKQNSSGISIGPAPGIDANSPQFQRAQNDCRSLVPFP